MYAIHVSTTYERGSLAFEYLSFSHPIYAALYCTQSLADKFRRRGVGRVFAKEAVEQFQSTEDQIIDWYEVHDICSIELWVPSVYVPN